MASASLERSIKLVFGHEGGYVNNPKDPGGPTKFGITQATLKAWRKKAVTIADVKALTLDEASQILRKQYWGSIAGDRLPEGLDHAVFDFAVNSGPAQAVRSLQRVVGAMPDGIMGTKTLAAIAGFGASTLIEEYCDTRLAFLHGLKTFATFGKGWATRVERVRTEARSLIKGVAPLQLYAPEATGLADPADTRTTATTDGKATVVAGIGVMGTACSEAANQIAPYIAMPLIRWLFVALTIVGIGIGLCATIRRIQAGNA